MCVPLHLWNLRIHRSKLRISANFAIFRDFFFFQNFTVFRLKFNQNFSDYFNEFSIFANSGKLCEFSILAIRQFVIFGEKLVDLETSEKMRLLSLS